MSTPSKSSVFFAACLLAVVASAHAEKARTAGPAAHLPLAETGTLGKAPYRIDIPSNWNGDVVVLAHGFEPVGVPRASPWPQNEATPVFLSAGYAVAQSAYASQGWAVGDALGDVERLRRHFVDQYGAARRSYLVGFSMGGGVAVASLEQHSAGYDGALSLCGANVPGRRLVEDLFTTLVAFDSFFPNLPGLPGPLADPDTTSTDQMQVVEAIAAALPGKPEAAARLAERLQIANEALPGVISLHYLIFHDIAQRAGGMPVDNRSTSYSGFGDDKAFNASVRRYAGDARAMQYASTVPALSGRPDKPLVIQYNRDDTTIAPRMQSIYTELAKTSVPAPVVLAPVGSGHCGFSPDEIGRAFKTLTDWVESGERPVIR
jgi:pimeloyl-ACP methyl ester carboxylesterase